MFNLGVPELIFILVLALLIFGPKRLPEIGRTLGKGMAEFRKASNELKRSNRDRDERSRERGAPAGHAPAAAPARRHRGDRPRARRSAAGRSAPPPVAPR